MIPILYEATRTTFDNNGLGILTDTISCTVMQARNGEFELEMEYPVAGIHYDKLVLRRIIMATPDQVSQPQPFRIYEITKPIGGIVSIYAQHIAYDLKGVPVKSFTASSAADAMEKLSANAVIDCPFSFGTSDPTEATMTVEQPTAIWDLLGGNEGSVLDVYGGEYEFDRFAVMLHNARGTDRGMVIRYGKNMTNLKQEESCANVYTGVYPYWKSSEGDVVTLPEGIVNASGEFSFTRIKPVDFSTDWDSAPTAEQLRTRAQRYITSNQIGTPDVSISVEYAQLGDDVVGLCDPITVEFPLLGVAASAKCIKTKFDVLRGRYESIDIGSVKTTLSDMMVDQKRSLEQKVGIVKARAEARAEISERLKSLKASDIGAVSESYVDDTFAKQSAVFADGLQPTFTNVLPLSQNAAGEVQNNLGYTYTVISGAGNETDAANWVSTGYIPVKKGDVLRFKNFGLPINDANTCRMIVYKADHTVAEQGQVNGYSPDNTSTGMNYIVSPSGGTNTVVLDDTGTNIVQMTLCRPGTIAYVRFTVRATGVSSKSIITVNEEIAYEAGYGTKLNGNIQVDSSQIVGDLGQRSPWDILPGAHLAIAYSSIGRMAINTKEHFVDCCKNYGYNVLKCDVRPTSDGKLVLCHDAGFTLDANGRITTYNAANSTSIHEMTAAQCIALEHADSKSYGLLGYYAKPCLIGDYLDACRAYGKVAFVTIRDEYMDEVVPKLLEELRAHNMLYHTIINSMTYASLVKWRAADSIVCLNYTLSRSVNITSTEIDQVIDLGNAMIGGFGFGTVTNESDITCDFTYANEKKIRVMNAIGYVSGAYENCIAAGYDGLHIGYPWGEVSGTVTDDHINALIDEKLGGIENGAY